MSYVDYISDFKTVISWAIFCFKSVVSMSWMFLSLLVRKFDLNLSATESLNYILIGAGGVDLGINGDIELMLGWLIAKLNGENPFEPTSIYPGPIFIYGKIFNFLAFLWGDVYNFFKGIFGIAPVLAISLASEASTNFGGSTVIGGGFG